MDISGYTAGGTLTETQRFEKAVGAVTDTLHRLADSSATDIYAVQELLLADAVPEVIQEINSGNSAVDAVTQRFTTAADQLETIDDPYLRARAQDQRGIMRMLLRALLGKEISPGLARGILILDELDPVTAGALDPWLCQGIITTSGGSTGHGAIVAQARGFALLTGKPEAHDIPEGTVVAIDPVANRLWINPTPSQIDELRGLQVRRQAEADEASRLAHEPALTQSGKRILVEANLASIQEAYDAGAAGAEGSGVVRTEILFGDWDHAPTIEEQAAAYIEIGKALNGGTITVRTWDPGGDKPLVFLPQDREANPMLGERGIRVMKRLPHLFEDQLSAILLASKEVSVRVMFPMITIEEEVVWARSVLADMEKRVGGEIGVGMMVETPSAALRAADFLGLVDFISIGTNDLTQYTLAADRGNPIVASITHGDNTSVWDLIAMAARAFAGRSVAVCGDLASDPHAVSRLISLGVNELSVRTPLVGVIKQQVRATA
ncbi:MAG: PEP-utilizing enzyme [Propionibacteriaceae bacterium]|nr:PEP-utilizing enzyme [Propionibacteriaceae bacterium]